MGISKDSPKGILLASTSGRDFHELAIRFGWQVINYRGFRADYTLDVIPFAMVTGNPSSQISFSRTGVSRERVYATHFGAGAAPFGLRMGAAFERVFVFASGSAGFLVFESPVPTQNAALLNFTFDFGVGIEAVVGERWSLLGGYKLTHLSNGDRGVENPGVDSNMIYFGTSWRR